ncbi:hypothetical protein QBA75_38900 [Streptomyces stelliscabiei]
MEIVENMLVNIKNKRRYRMEKKRNEEWEIIDWVGGIREEGIIKWSYVGKGGRKRSGRKMEGERSKEYEERSAEWVMLVRYTSYRRRRHTFRAPPQCAR